MGAAPPGPAAEPAGTPLRRTDGSFIDPRTLSLLVLDVDGVLTDGTIAVDEDGRMSKRFSILDGAGIKLFLRAGLRVAIISGHRFEGLRPRFTALGVPDVFTGVERKRPVLDALLARHGLLPAAVVAMGDDLMDLPLMDGVGFAATVPDAHPRVLARADFVTTRRGGQGAVREVVELILAARGDLDRLHAELAS